MSEINFIVTDAGREAALDASSNSIKLHLSKIALGTGHYAPDKQQQSLVSKFADNGIAAGGIELQSFTLHFTLVMNHGFEEKVSELGLYTSDGVLFAIAALEAGQFFTLYPSIDYIAEMGIKLENTMDLEAIEFVLDGSGGMATDLLQSHVTDPDPHPQYKELAQQLINEHNQAENPHPQYALQTYVDEIAIDLREKANSLLGLTDYLFPPLLAAGSDAGEDIKTVRKKSAIYDFIDRSLIYHICPEGDHEAWNSQRAVSEIKSHIWNRSGGERVGYSGRINWVMIDTGRVLFKRGFSSASDQLGNEIKHGVFEAETSYIINKEAWETVDYTSDDLVLMVSPEGDHEAWTVERTESQITINVFSHSGTERVGYKGRVSWSLFKSGSNQGNHYPRQVMAGTSTGQDFKIKALQGMDFSQSSFLVFITPENNHEGWSVKRSKEEFDISVFNRSGTERIGYEGRVNWAVFQTEINETIYRAGVHEIIIPAKTKASIHLIGAGGSGAGSLWASDIDGAWLKMEKGGDTTFTMGDSIELTAGGGDGGYRGVWNNGSAYIQGVAGAGGVCAVTKLGAAIIIDQENGEKAYLETAHDWCNRDTRGGLSRYMFGTGGEGGYTVETRKHRCYGAGGGSGAHLYFDYENNSDEDVIASVTVGDFAVADTIEPELNNGKSGESGCATVQLYPLL